MANTYEYIISLQDKASASMRKITGASGSTVAALTSLSSKTHALQDATADFGTGIDTLRKKIDLLQAEKELIPANNLDVIRRYNREIGGLEKQVERLDNAGRGGLLSKYLSEIGRFINPLTIGAAALGMAGKSAMSLDEGMAKINITAQLDESGLSDLKRKIKQIAKDNKADIEVVPAGFEKIISQVGSVTASLPILDAALKGTKAGFGDFDTTASALAQTLSIVGAENASAMEVLDTFLAAKRVGAGEFADFARYMPGLIAGASNLGMAYRDVAGVFAYMTGKGQSAERAAVLMENAFSILGKSDVSGSLKKAGVGVFDDVGKMRSVVDIFTDLKGVMGGMSDEQKSGFLEKIGVVDKEAKGAFAILTADVDKLRDSMGECNRATGETLSTLGFSGNVMQRVTELWNGFKLMMNDIGEATFPLICASLSVMEGVFDAIGYVVGGVILPVFGAWFGALSQGSAWVWGLTAALGVLAVALTARNIMMEQAVIMDKVKVVWDGVLAMKTSALVAAQWLYNTALYGCPIVWIIAAVGALVAAVVYCWQNFEGFRKVVLGSWEVLKEFGVMIWDVVISAVKNLISGLGSLGQAIYKLFTGDFKGAAQEAKNGVQSLFNANPIVATVKAVADGHTNFGGAWEKGVQNGAESWKNSQRDDGAQGLPAQLSPDAPAGVTPAGGVVNYDSLMSKLGNKGKGGNSRESVKLDGVSESYKGSTAYAAIASRLAPVSLAEAPVMGVMPVAGQMPVSGDNGENMTTEKGKPKVSFERFCDQIVINVQHATDKGYDTIRREISNVIEGLVEDYA